MRSPLQLLRATRLYDWARFARRVRAVGGPGPALLMLTPGLQWQWGGPMNGQAGRRELLRSLAGAVRFSYAVETGTYRGASTGFLADVTGAQVHSVEADPGNAEYARKMFRGREDVLLAEGDSREFLRGLSKRLDTDAPVLFYLDAHWDNDDLPVWEEIAIAFSCWRNPVVVIDDFAVPDDPGYGFDSYGPGAVLCLEELLAHLPNGVEVWFPVLASHGETGARRGCVVLVRSVPPPGWQEVTLLRRWTGSG